jgi:hypothetical protein
VSDEHKEMKKALRRFFPKAIWQRCQTHSPEGHDRVKAFPLNATLRIDPNISVSRKEKRYVPILYWNQY